MKFIDSQQDSDEGITCISGFPIQRLLNNQYSVCKITGQITQNDLQRVRVKKGTKKRRFILSEGETAVLIINKL